MKVYTQKKVRHLGRENFWQSREVIHGSLLCLVTQLCTELGG